MVIEMIEFILVRLKNDKKILRCECGNSYLNKENTGCCRTGNCLQHGNCPACGDSILNMQIEKIKKNGE